MTYEEAIRFWFARVNYEQKTPQLGDFKLDRMRQLLALVGNPQRRLRIIHVAGSKGKGSTSAMLAAILQQQGYRVGLFSSPHLVNVEERIQIDQQPIERPALTALLAEIRQAAPSGLERDLSFFEIGTALGLLHFVRRRVDFAIVEVGLGGRFDSTNVCDPLLSIVTSISFDHTQMLGDTLGKIAYEKAGIIKPGRPAISGVRDLEARQVIESACRRRGCSLRQLGVDFTCQDVPALIEAENGRWPVVSLVTWRRAWPMLSLRLIGAHQARNAAVAVAAVEQLVELGVPIAAEAVARGLAGVVWPARLEVLARRPLVLLDCAHNVASAHALVQSLKESFPLASDCRRILLFAGSRDKDLAGMLAVLAPFFDRVILTTFQNSSRCATTQHLAALLPSEKQPHCLQFSSSLEAWQRARQEASPRDLICVTGSVFLAGELRPIILDAASA